MRNCRNEICEALARSVQKTMVTNHRTLQANGNRRARTTLTIHTNVTTLLVDPFDWWSNFKKSLVPGVFILRFTAENGKDKNRI